MALLLWVLAGIVCFFILARFWVVAIEHFIPRAGSPGAGAVLLALITTTPIMLIVRQRLRRR